MKTKLVTIEVLRDPDQLTDEELQRALKIAEALGARRLVLCQQAGGGARRE